MTCVHCDGKGFVPCATGENLLVFCPVCRPMESMGMQPSSNVRTFPGLRHPDDVAKPNEALIGVLRQALAMAESGQLQCYIGTGFTHDGLRLATWCDEHDDKYQMLGALAWLQHEYVHRHTEALG